MPRFVGYIQNDRYAVGCTGQTVYVYNNDGGELARFKDIPYGYTPKFCPNQDLFVVKSTAGLLAAYSLSELRLLKKFRFSKENGGQDYGFDFSPDGAALYNVEVHPAPDRNGEITFAIGVYDTRDFSLKGRYFLNSPAWNPTNVEYDERRNVLFVLGTFQHRHLSQPQCFVAKLEQDTLSAIRFISQQEYDVHFAFHWSQMHGFSPLSNEWSLLKYQGWNPVDFAGKEYPLSALWERHNHSQN